MQKENSIQIKMEASALSVRQGIPTTERTDEDLLEEYVRTNNEEAFRKIVHRYEREMYSYLRKYLGNAQWAEDAFQETFLKLHVNCRQFDRSRKLRPWLYTIANNQAVDLLRRNRRHKNVSFKTIAESETMGDEQSPMVKLLHSMNKDPIALLQNAEESQRILAALKQIPDKLYAVINLVVYRGLKYQEAADVLGIPSGTVKSRMHTAIQRLKKILCASEPYAYQEF